MDIIEALFLVIGVFLALVLIGIIIMIVRCYRKVAQGSALVRNGLGGTRVAFSGCVVFPVIHREEYMDISVKRVEIDRAGVNGLICQDNMRADIKVAFFVRVNKTSEDVLKVAQSIGCVRASSLSAIIELFDAKFSEALKTVGRHFNFVELYNSREKLKDDIIKLIGTDLNGFVLEDVAIDYLEQTPLQLLNADNILDAEGIKKITELTANQKVLANNIDREREKTITRQNVQAREAVLELERQLAEAEEKQRREIAVVKAREGAESKKTEAEELLRSERARIQSEEEIHVAEENKLRQVVVARKNKERTEAVETERVERDRMLEVTERERIVTLAEIERDKALEIERKAIQEVIRERLVVEKAAVEERERIKDTEAHAAAEREKKVMITLAEKDAEEALVKDIKAAEAAKKAAELRAEQDMYSRLKAAEAEKEAAEMRAQELIILAEAEQTAATRQAEAKKALAEGRRAEEAAPGLAEAEVILARAKAEASGINEKAAAMKEFDGVGREHEEFKLRLHKDRDIEMADITARREIAEQQAHILGQALSNAKIDIVGGEAQFFDKITNAITNGKSIDRMIDNSKALTDVKETFFNSDPDYFRSQMRQWVSQFGLSPEDLKNLSVSGLLAKLIADSDSDERRGLLAAMLHGAKKHGMADAPASLLNSTTASRG